MRAPTADAGCAGRARSVRHGPCSQYLVGRSFSLGMTFRDENIVIHMVPKYYTIVIYTEDKLQ
jgi:hypothetical protein